MISLLILPPKMKKKRVGGRGKMLSMHFKWKVKKSQYISPYA